MKKILLYSRDKSFDENIFNSNARFTFNQPFIYLKNRLKDIGFELTTIFENKKSSVDFYGLIIIDSPFLRNNFKNFIKKFLNNGKDDFDQEKIIKRIINKTYKDKIVLLLWEGRGVRPENYTKSLHEKFQLILTWDDNLIDNNKFYKFYLPAKTEFQEILRVPFSQKKLLVNVSSDKHSGNPNELYSARRESIKFFENHYPDDFDLYGLRWKKDEYQSYRGEVEKKTSIISKYKFSICYENLREENGYITEKIFDCFQAGVVPIYWGANNIEEYVNKNSYVDRRLFKNNQELANYIVNIKEIDYNKYIKSIDAYLKSNKYHLFSFENFANTIINTLKLT